MREEYIFCLTPRCGFCSIRLEYGDDVIAMRKTGMAVSNKFRFSCKASIAGIIYIPCTNRCSHMDERAFGCHSECLEMVPFKSRSAVVKATSYQYEPPRREDERRLGWLRSSWSTILFLTFQGCCPLEICENIAQHSLESFATRRALALFGEPQQPESCFISLSTKVWVQYTLFEGVRYIQSLTNERPPDDGTAFELVHDSSFVVAVFFAEDHLGVRNLLFTSSSEKPAIKEQSNVWWRAFKSPDGMVEAKTNGARLLSLTFPVESRWDTFDQLMAWTTPQFLEHHWCSLCGSLCRLFKSDLIHMTAVRAEDPSITGYSVCCTLDLVAIHAHSPNEDTEFYRENESVGTVWQHMPMDKGEVVVEMWKIEALHGSRWVLAFRTNKDRTAVLGPWPWDYDAEWKLLHQPQPGQPPSQIFHESSSSRIRLLAFDRKKPPKPDTPRPPPLTPPPLTPPTLPRPASTPLEAYFHSAAALDGVAAVTPCRCRVGGLRVTRGLLLHHADGGVSCVGEVRLHALGPRREVDGALWLGFGETPLEGPSVLEVATERPGPEPGLGGREGVVWFVLPCSGRLEWWFSFRQCRVYYEGRASPETTEGDVVYRDSARAKSSVRIEW